MLSVLFTIVLVVLIILAVLALGLVGLLWYLFWRVLPATSGKIEIPGLGGAVEVVRDHWGVPHIYASNARDAFFAQGFVHAQDRLFQMEYSRRLARGTLAEAFGPSALEADRWSRVIGFARAVQEDFASLTAEDRAALAAYSDGVNAFLSNNRLKRPAEFTIVGHQPTFWSARDTLGIMKVLGWALSMNWEGELLRAQLVQHLGVERASELDPTIDPGAPSAAPADLTAAHELLAAYQEVSRWFGFSATAGSNNWVIGPAKVASRQPLLANDPHLTAAIPALWYENHLEATDGSLRVTGATFPGLPGVVTGHNADIGWGITAGRVDNQDLYVEQESPDAPDSYRDGDGWQPATVMEERILVRGQAEPVSQRVVITGNGPLINGLIPQPAAAQLPPLALRWSGHSSSSSVRGLLQLQTAKNWDSFRAALSLITEPSLNFVYADRSGAIGYQYAARTPRRRAGNGLVPAPGWDADYRWDGYVPFEQLPSRLNPEEGYAASANNRPPLAADSPWLGADWDPGYRFARIESLLQTRPRFTVGDFQRMQMDVYSGLAEAIVPFFILAQAGDQLEQRILSELESWNLRLEVDSFPAAAFEVMRLHLLDIILSDKLGPLNDRYKGRTLSAIFTASPFAGRTGPFLTTLLESDSGWWYHDLASGEERSRDEVLTLALQRTAVSLHQMIGKDPRKWAWGKVHQIEFTHPFGRGRLLRTLFNRGQFPISGNDHTIWMTAQELSLPFTLVNTTATYRQVLQAGDWERSTAILSTGQSGQPGSPHYADQIDMWREGEQHPMLWSRAAVEANTRHTLWLHPAGATSSRNDEQPTT